MVNEKCIKHNYVRVHEELCEIFSVLFAISAMYEANKKEKYNK